MPTTSPSTLGTRSPIWSRVTIGTSAGSEPIAALVPPASWGDWRLPRRTCSLRAGLSLRVVSSWCVRADALTDEDLRKPRWVEEDHPSRGRLSADLDRSTIPPPSSPVDTRTDPGGGLEGSGGDATGVEARPGGGDGDGVPDAGHRGLGQGRGRDQARVVQRTLGLEAEAEPRERENRS